MSDDGDREREKGMKNKGTRNTHDKSCELRSCRWRQPPPRKAGTTPNDSPHGHGLGPAALFSPPSLFPPLRPYLLSRRCLLHTLEGKYNGISGSWEEFKAGEAALRCDLAHVSDLKLREGGREG